MNTAMIMLISTLMSIVSIQATSTYDVRDYTCNELNQILDDERAIVLKYQLFFGGTGTHYNNKTSCRECYKPRPAGVKASDRLCTVGYKCLRMSRSKIKEENERRRDRNQRRLRCGR